MLPNKCTKTTTNDNQHHCASNHRTIINKKLIVINKTKITYGVAGSEKLYTQYAAFLLKREKLKRPQTLSSLKNEIASKLNLRGNTAKINEILDLLKTNDMITYQDNTDNPKLVYKK
ncbi:hypothetical protein AAUPMB_21352 [Pasteurella multocida subsp. multocida str. Anand1_buffalo]|nr:hypothetical protein AAUPMB_21352 [Pasteurella multocida subsp. multocida str. Anand1_buffalo]